MLYLKTHVPEPLARTNHKRWSQGPSVSKVIEHESQTTALAIVEHEIKKEIQEKLNTSVQNSQPVFIYVMKKQSAKENKIMKK